MAMQQNGYAFVPHLTYDEWRTYALTHGVNVDWSWGNQCWDICALLWYQYGLRLITKPGGGVAYECWTVSRDVNARPPFIQINNIQDIKRGDCIVFNKNGSYYTGHIGFADEDYNPNHFNRYGANVISTLGQNQGQGTASGTPSNIAELGVANILGAFRNTNWQSSPPEPTPFRRSGNFPWVLYSKKLRQSR